MNDQKKPLKQ